jgi:tight adherence protein B
MILVIAFVMVLLVSFALVALVTRPSQTEKAVQRRVSEISRARQEDHTRQQEAERILKEEAVGPFAGLDRLLGHFRFTVQFRQLAIEAGNGWTIGQFAAYSVGAAILCFVAAYVFFPALLLDGIAGAAALFVPWLLLNRKRAKRLQAFNNALPDAIDLMARALRAGHSLSSAIEVLSEQAGEAVASEFGAVFRQQNFGLPLRDCLLQMAERVPSKDLRFLVTAMLVQKETGGNLTEILDRTTRVIRERLRIEGEVRIHTAQGRMTGWILSLLPVVMLFLLNTINPGYSRVLLHDPLGQKLLYAGAGLILIGGFIITRIVDIKV